MKHCIIGLNERPKGKELVERTAVRGIIENKGKYLFVTTNREDCMFPGGGIEGDENHEDALIREVHEEAGYIVTEIKEYFGYTIERRPDLFEKGKIFEMISHFYYCKVNPKMDHQDLDDYEKEDGLTPIWLSLNEAIEMNETLLSKRQGIDSSWLERALWALRQIKEAEDVSSEYHIV